MMARASAMRTVMKESAKGRSGRRAERVVPTRPSGREGKMAKLLSDHEGVTTEREGDVVVPPAQAAAFEVVEPQLTLHVLVEAFRAPALLEDAHHLLGAELSGDRHQREVGGLGLALGPLDNEVLLDTADAYAATSEARAQCSGAAFAPCHRAEGRLRKRRGEFGNLHLVALTTVCAKRRDRRRRVDADRVRQVEPQQARAELADVAIGAVGQRDTERDAMLLGAFQHQQRYLPLGAIADVVWDFRHTATRSIVCPSLRQVQL